MKMTRYATALAFALAFALVSSAEDGVFGFPLDAAGRKGLAENFSLVSANVVVKGSYVQTTRVTRLGRDLVSRGDFVFCASKGIYWNILKPFPSTIVMTDDRLVQRSPDGKTSTLDGSGNAVFQRFAKTLRAVFSGDLSSLEDDFDVFYKASGSRWEIGLRPRDPAVREILTAIDVAGSDVVESLRLDEKSGDVVRYEFVPTSKSGTVDADVARLFVR